MCLTILPDIASSQYSSDAQASPNYPKEIKICLAPALTARGSPRRQQEGREDSMFLLGLMSSGGADLSAALGARKLLTWCASQVDSWGAGLTEVTLLEDWNLGRTLRGVV